MTTLSSDNRISSQNNTSRVGETTFHVRYAETDQLGIVHHSVYPIWFEEGRSALARQVGTTYAEFERNGFGLAVSELGARFLVPARYDQAVTIRTWVSQVRSRLIRFEYEVLDAENHRRLATGFTTHICVDHRGQPSRIPQDWLDFWLTLVITG